MAALRLLIMALITFVVEYVFILIMFRSNRVDK